MPELDVQLRRYLDATAPPVEFEEVVAERFRDTSVRPAFGGRSGSNPRIRPRRVRPVLVAIATLAIVGLASVVVIQGRNAELMEDASPSATTPGYATSNVDGTVFGLRADDLSLQLTVPTRGWGQYSDFALTKSTVGPQAAEAIIYAGRFPESEAMTLCSDSLWEFDPQGVRYTGPIDRIAAVVANDPGVVVLEAPTRSEVGGYPAVRVSVRISEDGGCDPGYFYGWRPQRGGTFWDTAGVGDRIRVWIVDLSDAQVSQRSSRRDLLFIAGMTKPDAGVAIDGEIEQIIHSVRIDGSRVAVEDRSTSLTQEADWLQLNEGDEGLHAGDLRFAVTMPRGHWETNGASLLTTSTQGPQGAEAVIYWTKLGPPDLTGSEGITACNFTQFPFSRGLSADVEPGLAPLGDTELTTVGGHTARHLTFAVRHDLGCDPGYFFGWKPQTGGMMWYTTDVGATIDVWFVDLDDGELFIAGIRSVDAPLTVAGEIDEIIRSIRFED